MDLGGWLRSLGLEQYEAAFRDNAINEKVLPRLTAEDLKDLGVVIVGHRRTLLDAIAALRADANAKAAPADTLPAIDTSPKLDFGQFRQRAGERILQGKLIRRGILLLSRLGRDIKEIDTPRILPFEPSLTR